MDEEGLTPTKHFKWGISRLDIIQPHVKRCCAFCQIDEKLFVTSDGDWTYFWTDKGLDSKLRLPAISLAYIEQNHHVMAYIKGSTHLHFIWMHKPYQVSVHPVAFSGRSVSSMFFFEKSQVLVTAGQGITFTSMVLPTVPEKGSCSQMIELKKIADAHNDSIFTFLSSPLFVDCVQAVVVPIENSLFVYSVHGRLIKHLPNVSKGDISSLSFDTEKLIIIAGDTEGNIYNIEYGSTFPCLKSEIRVGAHLATCQVYAHYFMITIGLDNILSLYCLIDATQMFQIKIDKTPTTVRCFGETIFVFSPMGIEAYRVSIFMRVFRSMTGDVKLLKRIPNREMMALQTNSLLNIFEQRFKGDLLGEIRASTQSGEIRNVMSYKRHLFVEFYKGGILMLDKYRNKAEPMMQISNDGENVIRMPPSMRSSDLCFGICGRKETTLYGIAPSGHVYVFPTTQKYSTGVEYVREIEKPITAVGNNSHLIVSNETGLFVVDTETFRLASSVACGAITCLLVTPIGLICGTAQGAVELRNAKTLELLYNSRDYNAFHSDKSIVKNEDEGNDPRSNPHAVVSLDYLSNKKLILSMSNNGEIFIWSSDMFPFVHFETTFPVHSSAFLNNGSIVLSAFGFLFSIDALLYLDEYVQDTEPLIYKDEKKHDKKQKQNQKPKPKTGRSIQPPEKPRARICPPKEPAGQPARRELPRSRTGQIRKAQSQISIFGRGCKLEDLCEPMWCDLVVAEEEIPKNHWISRKIKMENKPVKLTRRLKQKLEEDNEFENIRKSLDIPDEVPAPINNVEQILLFAPGNKEPPKPSTTTKKTKTKTSTSASPKSVKAKSARATQLLYPDERKLAGEGHNKYDNLNKPMQRVREEKQTTRSVQKEPPPRTSSVKPKPQQEPPELEQKSFKARPSPFTKEIQKQQAFRIEEPKDPFPSFPVQQVEEDPSDPDFDDRTFVIRLPDEFQMRPNPRRFTGVYVEDWESRSLDEDRAECFVEEEAIFEPPNDEPVMEKEEEDMTDMRPAMVQFLNPVFDYGSLGNLDMEAVKRELEDRERNLVIKKSKKGRKKRIKVTKVGRPASARRL